MKLIIIYVVPNVTKNNHVHALILQDLLPNIHQLKNSTVKSTLSGSKFHGYFIDKYVISNIQQ